MKVGDIIQEEKMPRRRGIIVEVDPLRKGKRLHRRPINEIIVLLTNGTLFYADPGQWEQIIEV